MLKIILLSAMFFHSDSLQKDSVKSVVQIKSFEQQMAKSINQQNFKYQHKQGFFCDFEDKLNKKNKALFLNIGVGNQ
ncbi:MAG: hypothetical protein R2836_09760 [Chitinophagales bacterium]|nr:hypothetical protein [Chitinophagales bacterium]